MAVPKKIKGRYEIKDVLGRGGMGVVYRALDMDPSMRGREVALKTILESPDRAALELFEKERLVLASLNHPNIIDIFDSGEFEENGERKPFFVMPLLTGQSLDQLLRNSSHRLTVERVVEIFTQACRGLHAAHEHGLVHRDLKPSNIFVLNDDSVKIIDFGVAHMVDNRSSRGQKGTLLYMSPEQLEMKPVSASSDIFSLGVVCYETLTQRRPFDRPTQSGVFEAILHHVPPPASELNPAVSTLMSRVIHKAMAKQPWHRFSSTREFAETLQKALRNEPIEIFDAARIQPRIERTKKAFDQGDYEFAGEILTELEAEGHVDPEMGQLRRRINQAVLQKRTRQLLETARTRFDEGEDPLALQKLEEALELDRDNVEALTLKAKIESRRSERQIESWLNLAHQHVENRAYGHARQALQNVIQMRPQEGRALQLLAEVDRDEQEYVKLRRQKEQLYQAAQDAWHAGDISTALDEMGQVIALDRRAPDTTSPERGAAYQSFYNQVRSDHDVITNAHAEARKHLADRNFERALALCDQYLAKYPNHALFKALKFDAQAQQRQALSAYIADIDRRAEAESDLDKRLGVLREALAAYPNEPHFERSLKLMQERHELVDTIVAKARLYEERGQFTEALGQWEILRTIYERYPGVAFEIERVAKRRDQQSRSQAKARWVEQIDSRLGAGDYSGCLDILRKAQTEFPNDNELAEIEKLARQGLDRGGQAQQLLAQGQESCAEGRFDEGLDLLRRAHQMDERNPAIRTALLENLTQQARRLVDTDWRGADSLAQEALDLDPGHPIAKNIRVLVEDLKRREAIDECITEVRRLQATNDLQGALTKVERAVSLYAREDRLIQLRDTLKKELVRASGGQSRQRDLEELRRLDQQAELAADPEASRTICGTALELAGHYPDDQEFDSLASIFRGRLETISPRAPRDLAQQAPKIPQPSLAAPTGGAFEAPPAPKPMQTDDSKKETLVLEGWDWHAALLRWQAAVRRYAETWRLVLAVLGVVFLVVGVAWLIHHHQHVPSPPPAMEVTVALKTDPTEAKIRIDGQDRGPSPVTIALKEGTYQLEVQKDGYELLSQRLDVQQGMAATAPLTLKPLPLKVQLFTGELKNPRILLDGNPSTQPQAPSKGKKKEWRDDSVQPGSEHTLTISSRDAKTVVSFKPMAGATPTVSTQPGAKDVDVVTVSTFAGRAHVQFSFSAAKITVDGQSYDFKPEGVDVSNIPEGTHTIAWEDNGTRKTGNFESGSAPGLAIFVSPRSESVAVRDKRPAPQPRPPAQSSQADSQEQQIYNLSEQARDAQQNGNYAEPEGANAIYYSKKVLGLKPDDEWAKQTITYSTYKERLLIKAALAGNNLDAARRMADALAALVPDDQGALELQAQVIQAQQANAVKHLPPPPTVLFSRQVTYMVGKKTYPGTLTIVEHHLKFVTGGQDPSLDLACSDIQVKDKGVFHKRGLLVSTKSGKTYEFESTRAISKEVESACKK